MSEFKQVMFGPVEVKWAKVHEPDEKFNKYSIQCVKLTDEQVKEIQSWAGPNGLWNEPGFDPKSPEDGMTVRFKTGNPLKQIVDDNRQTIGPDTLIGNGSICTIAVTLKDTTSAQKETKTQTYLAGIMVNKLVEFNKMF